MAEVMRYAEMKDSGVEWLGEIPSHWDTVSLKHITSKIGSGKTPSGGAEVYSTEGVMFLRSQNIYNSGLVIDEVSFISDEIDDEMRGSRVQYGDVLLNITGGSIGRCCLFDRKERANVNQHVCIIRAIPQKLTPQFLRYFWNSACGPLVVERFQTGGNRAGLNFEQIGSVKIPFCPLEEQQNIVSYLDDQCAQIDDIIASAKVSIEEYKAWKASVIYEAVTKGLDASAEMKDSGVEWIGMMPSHWDVCKFGVVASVKSNLVSPAKYPELPQVSPENIEKGSGKILPCQTVEESGVISGNHLFYKGQILYSKIRPRLNKVTIAPFDGLCSADMYPIETSQDYTFIKYMMLADSFVEQVILVTENRVKMPKINQNELGQILVCIPNIDEQKQIVAHLDEICSQIDLLINEKEALIADLESYKKSLIYEVVTGKRKVA